MADFRTHISVSTVAGAIFGYAGFQSGLPWETCIIGAGLCSVSGMLPDLDSDSGIPLREATTFASALVPMLMSDRLQRMGLGHEMMILVTGGIYFFIRFGIAEIFRRYTVHRGMWHSIRLPYRSVCSPSWFVLRKISASGYSKRWLWCLDSCRTCC